MYMGLYMYMGDANRIRILHMCCVCTTWLPIVGYLCTTRVLLADRLCYHCVRPGAPTTTPAVLACADPPHKNSRGQALEASKAVA